MKKFQNIITLGLLFVCFGSLIGQKLPAPYVFGKITQAELQMKHFEEDTSATAVYIMNLGQMKVTYSSSPKYTVKHYFKIKLLKKNAFDLADIELAYFGKKKIEKITNLRAQITLPNGEQIELSKKDFLRMEAGEFIKTINFTFPKVKVGAVIEYEYTLTSKNLFNPRDWFFQYDYPVKRSELWIKLPEDVNYACIPKSVPLTKNLSQTAPDGSIIYRLLNVPALKREPFVTRIEDYYAKLVFQLDKYGSRYFTSSWGTLAAQLMFHEGFGKQYTLKDNYWKIYNEVWPLLTNVSSKKDSIERVYSFLSKELTWNDYYSKGTERSVNDVFTSKRGNSGELNLVMIAALRSLNIKAHPVLVSTRSHGAMNAQYPILEQFNHILVRIPLKEDALILDLTDKFHPMGYPKLDALNYRGWMITDYEPEWVSVGFPSTTSVLKANLTLDETGKVVGNLSSLSNGYFAIADRQKLETKPNENIWSERLQSEFLEVQLDTIIYLNQKDISKTFQADMRMETADMATVNGELIYFSPILYTGFDENPFKSKVRQYNVDFPYPFREQYSLKLKIPEGYQTDELPESVNIYLRDKGASFKFIATQKENTLSISSSIALKQAQYTPEEYHALKDFFDQISAKFNEQIVMKKTD